VQEAQDNDCPRAVLLGASNLTIGLRHALHAAQARLGSPLEVLAALGRGRSYGADSYFLGRRLPGIDTCGVWPALASSGARPTWALVTDVGNDLPFGAAPATILDWVERTLDRLAQAGAHIVITALPLANLRGLPAWEIELWRRVIFPLHGVSRGAVLDGADQVDAGLRSLAGERGLTLIEHDAGWYGIDPIHVRRARRAEAWGRILGPWGVPDLHAATPRLPPAWTLVPERRWLLGRAGGRPQPCARLAGGTTLALY